MIVVVDFVWVRHTGGSLFDPFDLLMRFSSFYPRTCRWRECNFKCIAFGFVDFFKVCPAEKDKKLALPSSAAPFENSGGGNPSTRRLPSSEENSSTVSPICTAAAEIYENVAAVLPRYVSTRVVLT